MANILTVPISAPPNLTEVLVDFYDDTHRDLLLRSPAGPILRDSELPKTLAISTADLLTYFLFYKKRPGTDGHPNYREIRSIYPNALFELDGDLHYSSGGLVFGVLPLPEASEKANP